MNLFHPLFLFNFLIALYSYLLLPALLELQQIDKSHIQTIYTIGALSNILFTIGALSAILLVKKSHNIRLIPFQEYKINFRKFNILYMLLLVYLFFLMQITAGSITYFLNNLDKRQIFMQGVTSLTIPLFLMKYLFLYEFYIKHKMTLVLVFKFTMIIIVLGLFGRFYAVAFIIQFLLLYFIINNIKKVNLTQLLLIVFLLFNIIFVYGIFRYYSGVSSMNQFSGDFFEYVSAMDIAKISAIIATNFFDGADVLNKTIVVTEQIGFQNGSTFFVSIFKVLPKVSGIVYNLINSNLSLAFEANGFGAQIIGLIPEIYLNFGYPGYVLILLLGFFTMYLYRKLKSTFLQIMIFSIVYVNLIQLMRNGSSVFITFLWADFLMLTLFFYVKKMRFK